MKRQKRVLVAWEVGENFGHVLPLLLIARRLREAGCGVVFALRDLRRAAQVRAEGFAVLQAPCHPDRWFGPRDAPPVNFAEVLAIFGFADAPVLDIYVSAWRNLYTLVRPDLVIASYAPAAVLTARLTGIPAAILALPFELPPRGVPLPCLRPWEKIPPERHAKAEAAVVNVINRVARKRLRINALHELFDVDFVYLNTFAELDACGRRPGAEYGGVLFEADTGKQADWPAQKGRRVFAYLQSGMPGFAGVLDQIGESGFSVLVVAPGLPARRIRAKANLRVFHDMVSLAQVLPQCDAVLSYAGHGMAAAALLAGKPLALVPRNLEQMLTASAVVGLGAGVIASANGEPGIGAVLENVLADPAHGAAAQRFARKYAGYKPQRRADEIAAELAARLRADVP